MSEDQQQHRPRRHPRSNNSDSLGLKHQHSSATGHQEAQHRVEAHIPPNQGARSASTSRESALPSKKQTQRDPQPPGPNDTNERPQKVKKRGAPAAAAASSPPKRNRGTLDRSLQPAGAGKRSSTTTTSTIPTAQQAARGQSGVNQVHVLQPHGNPPFASQNDAASGVVAHAKPAPALTRITLRKPDNNANVADDSIRDVASRKESSAQGCSTKRGSAGNRETRVTALQQGDNEHDMHQGVSSNSPKWTELLNVIAQVKQQVNVMEIGRARHQHLQQRALARNEKRALREDKAIAQLKEQVTLLQRSLEEQEKELVSEKDKEILALREEIQGRKYLDFLVLDLIVDLHTGV